MPKPYTKPLKLSPRLPYRDRNAKGELLTDADARRRSVGDGGARALDGDGDRPLCVGQRPGVTARREWLHDPDAGARRLVAFSDDLVEDQSAAVGSADAIDPHSYRAAADLLEHCLAGGAPGEESRKVERGAGRGRQDDRRAAAAQR